MLTRQTLFASTPFETNDHQTDIVEIVAVMLYCDECHRRLVLPDQTASAFPAASHARSYGAKQGWLSVSSDDAPTSDICSDCRTNRSDKSTADEPDPAK